ncbi:MAG TPA: hypothetical protein VHO06_26615 [Polyangia bacterium]|nr:hypothetical protein [Polyangia bacterium]
MTTPNDELVFGWRLIAEAVGCSERYIRDLVTGRQLVATRRTDGAVGVRRTDLVAIAEELRKGRGDQRPDDLGERIDEKAHGAGPALRLVGAEPTPSPGESAPAQQATAYGDVAAFVFADLAAGRSLTQIVVDRKLSPDIVRRLHAEWLALSDADALGKAAAEKRLGDLEAAVAGMRTRLDEMATRSAGSDPTTWAAPKWILDGIAGRVGVIEQVLLACGMLVRRPVSTTEP